MWSNSWKPIIASKLSSIFSNYPSLLYINLSNKKRPFFSNYERNDNKKKCLLCLQKPFIYDLLKKNTSFRSWCETWNFLIVTTSGGATVHFGRPTMERWCSGPPYKRWLIPFTIYKGKFSYIFAIIWSENLNPNCCSFGGFRLLYIC